MTYMYENDIANSMYATFFTNTGKYDTTAVRILS